METKEQLLFKTQDGPRIQVFGPLVSDRSLRPPFSCSVVTPPHGLCVSVSAHVSSLALSVPPHSNQLEVFSWVGLLR